MFLSRRTTIFLGLMALNIVLDKKVKNKAGKKNNLDLPSFKNTLEVRSSMKGRIRFYSPVLKSNDGLSTYLLDQVKKIQVIKLCTINTVTGTILIEYDHENLDPQTLEGAIIKLLGLDKDIEGGRISKVRQGAGNFVSALDNGIYDFSNGILDLKSLTVIGFFVAALIDYRSYGFRTPDYMTLLWWSSSLV